MFSKHGIPERVQSDSGPSLTLVSLPYLPIMGEFLFR